MTANTPSFFQLIKNPIHLLAFGFGSGLSPVAPGTFGTLAAIPLFFLFAQLGLIIYLIGTLIICIAGIYICGQTAKDLGVHDHGGIVWDEIAGYMVTMALTVTPYGPKGLHYIMIGFLLFRFFDIVKPWPIKWLDKKVQGGFGIMIDDIIAGLFSMLCLQGIFMWVL